MYFEEVYGEVQNSRGEFSDNVSDSFGASVCEELFDSFLQSLETAENMCSAADAREAFIKAALIELRLMI